MIEVDIAPEQIVPASLEDLHQEISLYQEMLENSLKKFLSYAEQNSYSPVVKQAVEV